MSFITDLINKITNLRIKIGDKLNILKSQIGQLNSLTTNDKTSLVGAVNEVNNIQIGGRNLILNSQKYNSDSSIWYTPNSSIITPSVNGMIVGNSVLITPQFSVEFIDGEQYVISFDYISSTPSRIEYNGSYRGITEGNRISFPFVFNKNKQKTTIYFNNPLPGTSCVISNIKLEKGNKATDWTPAPEDQVSDWNETDSTKHSFIKNKPTIPTVNNGQLTLSTGTGLSGSANFTANQAGESTFSVAVANTHKLPGIAEWDDTLKKDESNTVTDDFSMQQENGALLSMYDDGVKISKGGIYSIYGRDSIKSYNQVPGASYQFQEILFPKRIVQNTEEKVYPITYINGVKANENGRVDISSFNINWSGLHIFSQTLTAPSFYESSLRKFKYNIKPFEKSALDIINSLEIVTYDRKDIDLKNKIGVIADDSPNEILSESKEAVDLYKTIFVLAKAVQELSNKIK